MTDNPQSQAFCAALSAQAGEPLFATAAPTSVYLLLEDQQTWGKKAVEDSRIPEPVKTRLSAFAKELPAAKFLLVKGPPAPEGPRFFVAVTDYAGAALYEFPLRQYEDLLAFDLPAVLSGAAQYQAWRRTQPLFLVCTNARRDACCAKFGLPVYEALQAATSHSPTPLAWQMSHVGGHRFAANLLILPHGLLYGRLSPADVPALLEAHHNDRVLVERLRGFTGYTEPVQAADYFLRQQTGQTGMRAFQLLDERSETPQEWRVRFTDGSQVHSLAVALEKSETSIYESCTLDKTTALKRYRLLDYTARTVQSAN